MADRQAGVLVQLRKLLQTHTAKDLTDGQLLGRFAAQRDESAFAALMQRHGPRVYGMCRHLLGHEQDAEDAFQATFLVLARKASTIRQQASVAGWLHGVAYRLSLKARQRALRRRTRESQTARSEVEQPPSAGAWRELQAILDEELHRLPEKYRTPFILCVLEGKSKSEAARELEWKEGTVSSRLAKARELLQTRLARRGVTLSSILCGLAVADNVASAAPVILSAHTLEAAKFAGQAATVASTGAMELAEEMVRSMAMSRLRSRVAVLLLVLTAATSAAFYLWRPREPDPPPEPPPPILVKKGPEEKAKEVKADLAGKMVVRGMILGPDGKPVPRATVAIVSDVRATPGERDLMTLSRSEVLGTGVADEEGRFHLTVRRTSLERDIAAQCLARGPNESVGWHSLYSVGDDHPLKLQLEAGQQVRGRLVDHLGVPAPGVPLRVRGFIRSKVAPKSMWTYESLATDAWPPTVVSDAKGEFLIKGLVPMCSVYVEILDKRFAPQWLVLKTEAKPDEPVDAGTLILKPPIVLEGTVVAADSGEPIANAHLLVNTSVGGVSGLQQKAIGRSDDQGRFTIHPYPGKFMTISACGAPGTPFLGTLRTQDWPPDAERQTLEIRLPRGLIVRGRVIEEESGKPVAEARIEYRPMGVKNKFMRPGGSSLILWRWMDSRTDADGQFRAAVLPGPGHLLVRGPANDHLSVEVSDKQLTDGGKGGTPYFPDGLAYLDLKPGEDPPPITVKLRRGVTVVGRALRADGQPVKWGILLSRTYRTPEWDSHADLLHIKEGRFEIPGCDPLKSQPMWLWDPETRQGAVVETSGKDGTPTVYLKPTGSVSMRFVDSEGKVLRKPNFDLDLLLRPGPDVYDSRKTGQPPGLRYSAAYIHDARGREDAKTGVVTISELIPGATYLLSANPRVRTSIPRTFSVAAGEHLSLGDIVVETEK